MPEMPNFDEIAERLITRAGQNNDVPPGSWHVTANTIAEQLRLIWNARGAADIAQLEVVFLDLVPPGSPTNAALKHLERRLRSLDR